MSETPSEENPYKSVLKVWSVAGDDAGYGPGNPYTCRCWDASEGTETDHGEILFDDLRSEAYAGDVFPGDQNPYSIATLIFSKEEPEEDY